MVFRKDDEYGAKVAEIHSGFYQGFRVERTSFNRNDCANENVGLKDATATGGEDALARLERGVFGKETETECRVVIKLPALAAEDADFRRAFGTDRDLALFIRDQKDGGAVLEGAVDDADEAVIGEDGKLDANATVFTCIDLHGLPPGGGVPADNLGGHDIEIGRLFEIQGVAEFAVFAFQFFETAFDDAEAADLAFDCGKLGFGFLGVLGFLKEGAGLVSRAEPALRVGAMALK